MKNEMAGAAEHVLSHGTAKTRAAAKGAGESSGKSGGGGKDGKMAAGGAKKLRSIEAEKAHDGSYVMKHRHHPPHEKPEHDETYTAPDMAALQAHMEEHMGDGASGADASPEEQQEAAAAGGESGAAGAAAG